MVQRGITKYKIVTERYRELQRGNRRRHITMKYTKKEKFQEERNVKKKNGQVEGSGSYRTPAAFPR